MSLIVTSTATCFCVTEADRSPVDKENILFSPEMVSGVRNIALWKGYKRKNLIAYDILGISGNIVKVTAPSASMK